MINERTEFQGSHFTPQVKTALRREASKRGTSMSELVYVTMHKMLVEAGHKLGPVQEKKR